MDKKELKELWGFINTGADKNGAPLYFYLSNGLDVIKNFWIDGSLHIALCTHSYGTSFIDYYWCYSADKFKISPSNNTIELSDIFIECVSYKAGNMDNKQPEPDTQGNEIDVIINQLADLIIKTAGKMKENNGNRLLRTIEIKEVIGQIESLVNSQLIMHDAKNFVNKNKG